MAWEGTNALQLVKAFEEANNIEVPYDIVIRKLGNIDFGYTSVSKDMNKKI